MDHLAVTVGYKYSSTAIIEEESTTPHRMDRLELNGRPFTVETVRFPYLQRKRGK